MTIAGMILVNSPGNETAYAPLEHAAWNGCTPTDLVFPFFLFIVGVSLVFSLAKRQEQTGSTQLFQHIARRAVIIFGLGLVLNGFPSYHLSTLRIPGVLQRIGLCYFFASFLYLKTNRKTLMMVVAGLLIGYWILMTRIPVPQYGPGDLSKEGNLAAYVDRQILSPQHMYKVSYDPEGILSTLPAIASTLLGVLTAFWLRNQETPKTKTQGMLWGGVVLTGLGALWGFSFPINKALWTSSYVLLTTGLALLIFSVCYWAIEVQKRDAWGRPFEVFGVNAIGAYVLHILFLKIQNHILMQRSNGSEGNLRLFITDHIFGSWAKPPAASLLYALSYTLFWLAVFGVLYKKRIFIKV